MGHLTIGQVAARADVHKETIRYYQSLGLLEEPPRSPGSIRRYGETAVARLRFIKRAQQLGFSLDEVGKLLLLEDGQDCARTRKLAEGKLRVIRERIIDLRRMGRVLEGLIAECRKGRRPRCCPIIDTLTHAARTPSAREIRAADSPEGGRPTVRARASARRTARA